ncbi:MAG: DUF3006 domain-containing protein [Bacillota bacterium]
MMRVVIDRFEGPVAVLLFGESGISVPVPQELLPPEAVEGDILELSFRVDRQLTGRQREKITGLLHKLQEQAD